MNPYEFSNRCLWAMMALQNARRQYQPNQQRRRMRLFWLPGRLLQITGIVLHDFGRWLARDEVRIGLHPAASEPHETSTI